MEKDKLKQLLRVVYNLGIRNIDSKLKTKRERNAFFIGLLFQIDFDEFQGFIMDEVSGYLGEILEKMEEKQ